MLATHQMKRMRTQYSPQHYSRPCTTHGLKTQSTDNEQKHKKEINEKKEKEKKGTEETRCQPTLDVVACYMESRRACFRETPSCAEPLLTSAC
jgi:hypothetical protein